MSVKVILTCQIGKSLDLAKFAINSAIKNSGMEFQKDFDIVFICWKTSDEVYQWLEDNGFSYITLDYEKDPNQSFHHLLYNGWRAGYDIAYQLCDWHVPIATDHYFFKDWLKNLYGHRKEEGITSCTLIERGKCFSLHPTCDLGLTSENEFDYELSDKIFGLLYVDYCVEDKYNGRCHLDGGIEKFDGFVKVRQDAMPFIISKQTYQRVGPMMDYNEHGTTGDAAMFDRCIDLGIPRYRSCSSISYHVGAVETNRNKIES